MLWPGRETRHRTGKGRVILTILAGWDETAVVISRFRSWMGLLLAILAALVRDGAGEARTLRGC
jgi:hypothetical protein